MAETLTQRRNRYDRRKIYKTLITTTPKKRAYGEIFKEYWGDLKYCQKCGCRNKELHIHHINKKHNDNHPLNLIKLCLRCHTEAHKGDGVYIIMKKRLDFINSSGDD